MNLVRPFLAFSAVLLGACDKSPEVATGSSKAEGEVASKVERKFGDKIDGIDVSTLEGWAELRSEGRAVVADFIREARSLDPEWLELQRSMNAANEPEQFVAALDRFTPALAKWMSEYSMVQAELRSVDGLRNAEYYLSPQLQSKGPDLNAIVGKVGEVYERFSKDPEVRASLQKLNSLVTAINDLRSMSRQ